MSISLAQIIYVGGSYYLQTLGHDIVYQIQRHVKEFGLSSRPYPKNSKLSTYNDFEYGKKDNEFCKSTYSRKKKIISLSKN